MARYAIWDKQSDIYTLGRDAETGKMRWTAQEYMDAHAQWAANPNVKVIVGGGAVNGTVFMEFEATKEFYARQGAAITEGMTDAEVLAAIEAFEDAPSPYTGPTAQERIAVALENQNALAALEAEEKGLITAEERAAIAAGLSLARGGIDALLDALEGNGPLTLTPEQAQRVAALRA